MNYWLVKSEPNVWSWSAQVKCGAKGTSWSGVRNHAAKNNLMAMKKKDQVFFYHSNVGKEIVGIAEVVKEHYIDVTDETGKFVAVDIKAVRALKKPVTLEQVKGEKKLQDIELLKYSRLSVQKVTKEEWDVICKIGSVN